MIRYACALGTPLSASASMKLLRSIVAEATMVEGALSSSVIRHGPVIATRLGLRERGGGATAEGPPVALALAPAITLRSSRGGTAWMRRATIDVSVASPNSPP